LGRLAASGMHVPVIVHTFHGNVFHSYFNSFKSRLIVEAEKYLAKKSSAIIAISEQQKEDLVNRRICFSDKIHIIPLGFDLVRFREEQEEKRKSFRKLYSIQDDEIAVGIIGRLVPVKNHSLFLSAFKKVRDKTSRKVKAFIIGDGEERARLEALAHELNLEFSTDHNHSSAITFTSWIKNIDWAMAGLDIIALTSNNEGTPVSIIEAQAAGKAVVSTNVGGIKNIVIPNETALLSESNDVEGFSANLLHLVENESLRMRMKNTGWKTVENKFSHTRLIQDMKKLYAELLSSFH
jgi:glycosyltransferase involved in cell wall biosynthesis